MLNISVEREGSAFVVTLENVSDKSRALRTPLSAAFYALHAADWRLFVPGAQSRPGLKALATKGDAAALAAERAGEKGIAMTGSVSPIAPGESATFKVSPTAAAPRLIFATMVSETNDAFIAPPNSRVALLDGRGEARPAQVIEDELRRVVSVWDAGCEENEAVGGGEHQPVAVAMATPMVRGKFANTTD